ncbi:MAG TPA: Smr/MutS family protein [Stellaceae bacterium]
MAAGDGSGRRQGIGTAEAAGRPSPRPQRRHRPTDAELELWRTVVRGVRPLPGRRHPAAPEEEPPATAAAAPPAPDSAAPPSPRPPQPAPPPERRPIALPDLSTHRAAPGLDKRSAERLKRGQYPIEARLDLHGMTQDEAHGALGAFLARAEARGLRCLLVITGKGFRRAADDGGPENGGVLRRAVPRWLNEGPNRARVLAFTPAQPQHGGGGALYILIRRHRGAGNGSP